MARITFTLGTIKGSIGGLTFQGNTSGSIIRQRPAPRKSSTLKQQASHANFLFLLKAWQDIAQDDRDLWNTYASLHEKINKTGESKLLTGMNWFISVNSQQYSQTATLIETPADYVLPDAPPAFQINATPSVIEIELTEVFDFTNNFLLAWGTPPTNRNKPTTNQINKFLCYLEDEVDSISDITTAWETATGLQFQPTTFFKKQNIFICIQSIRKSSGISSAFLCSKINTASIVRATGGTITEVGNYTIHTFTSSGTFTAFENIETDCLIVAGGGSGGNANSQQSGGGGAGGVLILESETLATGAYDVSIGAGGTAGTDGSDSSIDSLIAIGGGAGGSWNDTIGHTGGSGGGNTAGQGSSANTGTEGQGYKGGSGSGTAAGGGGGGASEEGFIGVGSVGGNGGDGVANSYSGASVYYGGGGGGGGNDTEGAGGNGGGGAGQHLSGSPPVAGTANTGGGGGAALSIGQSDGASGGSGIVIIRYLTNP